LVKVREAPANRYLYYLTPQGFAEKARLTARFLSTSLTFYRQAGKSCNGLYAMCAARSWSRLMLCGVSDLAEIAFVRALEASVDIVGVFDPACRRKHFFSVPVVSEWLDAPHSDAWLLTDLTNPVDCYRRLAVHVDKQRILIPSVLGINIVAATDPSRVEPGHNESL
jgi:hypothetical protein